MGIPLIPTLDSACIPRVSTSRISISRSSVGMEFRACLTVEQDAHQLAVKRLSFMIRSFSFNDSVINFPMS